MIDVRIDGLDRAAALVARLEVGCRVADATVVLVGTDLPYAYGQHEGRHRGGRLARRAGGTFFLTRAAVQVAPRLARRLAAALPGGPTAVGAALAAGGHELAAAAVPLAPVRAGSLRRSIHVQTARLR